MLLRPADLVRQMASTSAAGELWTPGGQHSAYRQQVMVLVTGMKRRTTPQDQGREMR